MEFKVGSHMLKCALITGVYGQDGSLLAEYLLGLGYRVVGLVNKRKKVIRALDSVEIIETDISDPIAMRTVFDSVRPDECYHLAAYHHSSEYLSSTDVRWQMMRINFHSTQAILDALIENAPACHFLYAGSSQMYTAKEDVTVIDEFVPFSPSTYYGITKVASAHLIELFRRERGLWGLTTILFNHESTRRSKHFLSRKVTSSAAAFKVLGAKAQSKLEIRDLAARTDWSSASDFVRAMHGSLQVQFAKDYVLASGETHTVGELVKEAFTEVDLDWSEFVEAKVSDSRTTNPCLVGDPGLAQRELGWYAKQSFPELIREMVQYDLAVAIDSNL
jgi:GDPmannose 4,6-dehydratase